MADIRVEDYRLRHDGIQWIVTRISIVQKGDKAGQERESDHSYFARLSHALGDLFERMAGGASADSVASLREDVKHAEGVLAKVGADVSRARHPTGKQCLAAGMAPLGEEG